MANLVGSGLEPRAITGARLLSDPTVTFETLGAGQSVTAKYRLLSQKDWSGHVQLVSGDSSNGADSLTTGIDERGVPLAPTPSCSPKATDHLPPSLVAAAQRVLGQAFSIATHRPKRCPQACGS